MAVGEHNRTEPYILRRKMRLTCLADSHSLTEKERKKNNTQHRQNRNGKKQYTAKASQSNIYTHIFFHIRIRMGKKEANKHNSQSQTVREAKEESLAVGKNSKTRAIYFFYYFFSLFRVFYFLFSPLSCFSSCCYFLAGSMPFSFSCGRERASECILHIEI